MAGIGQGTPEFASGKVKLLRVTYTGDSWGAGNDELRTEVIVQLEGFGGAQGVNAVGFDLHVGDKELPNRLGMLSVLRDAYIHDLTVGIAYWLEPGKHNGYLARLEISRP